MPDGWAWCRLNSAVDVRDGTHDTPKYVSSGVPLITSKNLNEGGIDYSNVKFISEHDAKIINMRSGVDVGDILYAMIGTIGNPALIKENILISIKNVALFKFDYSLDLYNEYILLFLQYAQKDMKYNASGGLQPFVSLSYLRNYLVPIPPINEQRKISDVYKNIERTIENNKSATIDLISSVKSKILDLAIRGKLVPQNPDDEPASVLLERIKSEKEELIKQSKIRRDKKESVIFKGEDNSYYADLPSGWCVSTLGNLTTSSCLNDGDWILSDNMVKFGNIKLIQLGSVGFMRYIDKSFKYLTDETFEELGCTEIHSGYLLINRIVSDKMSACILPKIEGKKITTVDTCWISPCDDWYNLKYILYAISSPQFQSSVMLNSSGTTRKRISKLNLISLPLAIPPLEEQKRIVNAIETAFEHLDNILNNL